MQIQLLIQTIILPFIISIVALKIFNKSFSVAGIFIAWLASYVWMLGRLPLLPQTAEDSLWVFLGVAILISYILQNNISRYGLMLIYILCLAFISYPILKYEITISFISEMVLFIAAAYMVLFVRHQNNRPAFSVVMGFTVMAVITALSGSLLIAQLAGAVAAATGIYALLEIKSGLKIRQMEERFYSVFILFYLIVLYIARIFAEVDLYVVIALLVAAIVGLFARKNTILMLSTGLYIAAVVIMFNLDSGSSYY